MGEPIDLGRARAVRSGTPDGGANLACYGCGAEWWKSPGIVIDADGMSPTGFALPLTCTECGLVISAEDIERWRR